MKKLRFLVCFDMVLMPNYSAHTPQLVCWHDWQMRLRIGAVPRYRWPNSWGAFSGCSGFCCGASAIAGFLFSCCFSLFVGEVVVLSDDSAVIFCVHVFL